MFAVRDKSLLAKTICGLIFKRNTVFLKIQILVGRTFLGSKFFKSVASRHFQTKTIETAILIKFGSNLGCFTLCNMGNNTLMLIKC